eukprot:scaffold256449_cov28-Tisochrysis_lutea.AAC.7
MNTAARTRAARVRRVRHKANPRDKAIRACSCRCMLRICRAWRQCRCRRITAVQRRNRSRGVSSLCCLRPAA